MKTLLLGLLLSAVVLAVHSEDKVKPGKKSDYLAKVFSKKTAKRGDVCENTCYWSNDGECDDGGPGSQYSLCDLGTDCGDCGSRYVPTTCENTCSWAYDGECDDGGPGSLYSVCEFGTDCADCGDREEEPEVNGCTDTCSFPNDGDCDDGGPGSQYSICDLGTDCGDCGPRGECTDTCSYAHDGECDDGGEGSLYSICTHGTDCADCGVRLGRSLEMKKGKVAKTSSSQGKGKSIKDMVAEKAKVVKQPPSKPGNVGK